jgi:Spy/CpxP family protein refolding chaperone
MRTTQVTMIALALSVSVSGLEAQGGRGPGGARRGGPPAEVRADTSPRGERARGPRDAQIARGQQSPAAMLLRQRERLALTSEQITRLEALAATQRTALAPPSPAQALRLRADLLDAMQGTGNPQAARAALDKMSAQRNERIVAGLRAQQEARAVLTETQRVQVDDLRRNVMRQFASRGRDGRGAMRGGPARGGAVRGAMPRGAPRGVMPRGGLPPGTRRG